MLDYLSDNPTVTRPSRPRQRQTHGADFHIHEPEHAYLTPAKLLAMTAIDLLYDEAAQARQIIGEFQPAMSKSEYLAFARGLFKKERWSGVPEC